MKTGIIMFLVFLLQIPFAVYSDNNTKEYQIESAVLRITVNSNGESVRFSTSKKNRDTIISKNIFP